VNILNYLSVLSNKTRLQIFEIIINEAKYCSLTDENHSGNNNILGISSILNISKSTVHHHVDMLKKHHLLIIRQKGKYNYLFPDNVTISKFIHQLNNYLLLNKQISKTNFIEPGFKISIKFINELIDYIEIHGFSIKKSYRLYLVSDSVKNIPILELTFFDTKIRISELDNKNNYHQIISFSNLIDKFINITRHKMSQ
jgi:DNA-binding transcriptional ArsR family regulator